MAEGHPDHGGVAASNSRGSPRNAGSGMHSAVPAVEVTWRAS